MKLNSKKILEIIVKKIFFTSFVVFLLALFTGFLFFSKYNLRIEEKISKSVFFFDQITYKNIILLREKEEKKFLETESKEYPNLFERKAITNNKEILKENKDVIKEDALKEEIIEDIEEEERKREEIIF